MGVCCYQFLKYISVIWSLLFMVMGGVWFGLVLWIYLDEANLTTVTNDIEGFNYLLYFLMVVGAIVFILGFLGCCGACQESQCMLATFFALVFVLFTAQVAAGVWVKSDEDRFVHIFTETITDSIRKDYGRDQIKTQAFDTIQTNLKCCGSNGPTDWLDSYHNGADLEGRTEIGVFTELTRYNVPASCCMIQGCNTDIYATAESYTTSIYTSGCSKKMLNLVKTYSNQILYIILAILLIQVLAMILSIVLCCTVRRIDTVKG